MIFYKTLNYKKPIQYVQLYLLVKNQNYPTNKLINSIVYVTFNNLFVGLFGFY